MSLLEHPTAQVLLADAEVSATAVAGCRQRLQSFLQRYLPRFYRVEQHGLAEVVLQGVSPEDLWASAIIGVLVLGALVLFHKELVLVAFDSEMAEAVGLPVWLINLGLLLLMALTIVVSLRAVGNILVVAMLVTPAAAARLWTDRLVVMMVVSALFGALGGVLGLLLSLATDWAAGGTIVLVVTAWFGVSLLVAPRHGLLGRVRGVRASAPARVADASPVPTASRSND